MADNDRHSAHNWVVSLRRFVEQQADGSVERCDLCSAVIASSHAHLIEPRSRKLLCACTACALLFDSPDANHYRRVPAGVTRLHDFKLSDAEWDAFLIPINMAFFFKSSADGRIVAMYPGPAGGTESTLDLDAWDDLSNANPVLQSLETDVEALLINRIGGAREYYRVPIDRCYELTGAIRRSWHGLSGGEGVRNTIGGFFSALHRESGNGAALHA